MSKNVILGGAVGILLTAAVGVVALTAVFGDFAVADEKKDKDEKVITTKSGLKYVDQKVGDGTEAKAGSKVKVHYTGTLENGKKFDSSLDRGELLGLTLGAGWSRGGMRACRG